MFRNVFRRRSPKSARRAARRFYRPRLESLEGRLAPAVDVWTGANHSVDRFEELVAQSGARRIGYSRIHKRQRRLVGSSVAGLQFLHLAMEFDVSCFGSHDFRGYAFLTAIDKGRTAGEAKSSDPTYP